MIAIPLYIFLFLYIIFLAVFASFILVILYHIVSTGSFTFISFFVSFFVLAATVLILYLTSQILSQAGIDWQQGLTIFNPEWISGFFNPNASAF